MIIFCNCNRFQYNTLWLWKSACLGHHLGCDIWCSHITDLMWVWLVFSFSFNMLDYEMNVSYYRRVNLHDSLVLKFHQCFHICSCLFMTVKRSSVIHACQFIRLVKNSTISQSMPWLMCVVRQVVRSVFTALRCVTPL